MKTITAADANRHFSKLLREVQGGEEVTITSHGRPVARMVPAHEKTDEEREAAFDRLMTRLQSQPVLNLPKVTRDEIYEDI
jgi:prevent-host-death family protein